MDGLGGRGRGRTAVRLDALDAYAKSASQTGQLLLCIFLAGSQIVRRQDKQINILISQCFGPLSQQAAENIDCVSCGSYT